MPTVTGRATDFITFSRASGATVVDTNGAIKWAGHNLVLNSGSPATQTLTVEVGRVYTVECTGSGSVALSGAGTGTVSAGAPVTVTASTTSLVLTVSGSVTTMWAYRSGLGGMVLNPATGTTYYPTTGSIYNAPRLDYDPVTLAPRGLLVEEQRSNLLVMSEDLASAPWSNVSSGLIITADATTAPTGGATADLLKQATTTSQHRLDQTPSSSAGAQTFSVYAKYLSNRYISLRIGTIGRAFDLLNGTVGNGTATPSITPVGNGWYRCSIHVAAAAANDVCRIGLEIANATGGTYTGDGVSGNYFWGAQLEAGSFATSYIPTLAASATRSADVASVATSSFPYNQSEGTIVVNGQFNGIGTNPMMMSLYTGSGSSDYTVLYVTTASNRFDARFANAGSSQGSISYTAAGTPTINTTYKGAIAYKQDDFAMTVNGNTIATDTVGNVPPAADTMKLGVNPSNGQSINGYIRQITYIPRRLTNAELQTRTA